MSIEFIQYSGRRIGVYSPRRGAVILVQDKCLMGMFRKSDSGYEPISEHFGVITQPDQIRAAIDLLDKDYFDKETLPFDENSVASATLIRGGFDLVQKRLLLEEICSHLGALVSAGVKK